MGATRRAAVAVMIGLVWLPAQVVAQNVENDSAAPRRAHPPVRIRVHPLPQSYPGPGAVRQCTAWLAPEYRPSGTVIVPNMHCWWERG
jgi:hypothetical protein